MNTSNSIHLRPRFGVLGSWIRGDYYIEFISGIEHEAKRSQTHIFYFAGRSLLSPHRHENNYNFIYDAAHHASLDGLVIMSMSVSDNIDKKMDEFIEHYASIPLVTINFKASHGNAIFINNNPGFCSLLQHLIEVHGYRKLAFINGPDTNIDAAIRFEIFRSTLESYGIPFDSALITKGYYDYFSGKEGINTFINERKLNVGKDMDVIVCASDQMAWGAMDGLRARGISVPADIAVTGFDDIRYVMSPNPPVTTVRQHVFETGRAAIANLLDYNPERPDLVLDTEFIIRTSCGCGGDAPIPSFNVKSPSSVKPEGTVHDNEMTTMSENISVLIDGAKLENTMGISGDRKDMEVFFSEIISIFNNLKLIKDMNEFDDWMVRNLPILGIKSAYLLIYTTSPLPSDFVRLIAGYDRKKSKQGDLNKVLPLSTVFNEIISHPASLQSEGNESENNDKRQSYCILPVHYKDEQYGLLFVEINVYSSIAYDTICSQIGNTIKSMILMEEVRTMNQKLEETNTMLRHANEQKTRFFINVAHDTKTPLTLIQNYLERSMKRYAQDTDLAIVKQNVDILLENILNVLDVERLARGTMSFSHETLVNLSKFTREKCVLFRPVAEKKNITINLYAEVDLIIKIDPWALDRILNNLLDNAVKYTHLGGRVSVKVKKNGEKVIMSVSDNGPGLPGDTIAHLFEPYYLLSRKRSSNQGIGVGLSIVKKIIDDLGASIIAGNNKSRGACFTCEFTGTKETEEEKRSEDILPSHPLQTHLSAGIIFKEDIMEEEINDNKVSILIVDDNIQLLHFLKMSLKKTYNVFLATNVAAALAKLKFIDRPELIISDIMMDDMDGHTLLATLIGIDEYCDIPFIFLTAASSKDEELRGLTGGAIDYIKKPFSFAELEKKIESIIALRERMKKHEIMNIRNEIDGLFSNAESKKDQNTGITFEALCIKYGFSIREREIVTYLLQGLLTKEIAFRLHLSQRAVEYHITNIFKKAGITKRYELLLKFGI